MDTSNHNPLLDQVDKLAKHNRQGSYQTRLRYYEATIRLCIFLTDVFHLQKLSNMSGKHLVAYVEYLQDSGKSASTIKTDLAAIRFFHDLIPDAKYRLPRNDELGIELEDRQFGGKDRTWSGVELNRMIGEAVGANRDDIAVALYLGYCAGLRIHEVCRNDTATAEKALREGAITIKGKGGKVRTVPIEDERINIGLQRMLERTARGHKLFVPDGVPTDRAISGIQQFIIDHRDAVAEEGRETNLTFHGLRHSFAAGSVYQRKDGKWVGQVTVGYKEDTGKPVREYCYTSTREEAAHWVALKVAAEPNKDTHLIQDDLILRDFIHQWLTTFKVYEVSSRTMELYYGSERLHIVPAMGMMPLKKVTPIQIQTFLYQLQSEKQLSRRTITLVRSVLIQMYDYAIDMGLVENNPARNAKLPKQPRSMIEKEKVISIAQREAILKAAEADEIMSPILTMLMLTGMRIGEVLALQWKHIDFAAKTINICQSLTRELVFDEDGKTQRMADTLGTTKTQTSRRQIQAPDLVLERLRRWMQYVAKRKGGLDVLVPDGFVFVSTRTMQMRTYSGFRASYRHFLERNNFGDDNLNLHRYRHTYASMLLEQGVNPKVVQKLLGHRDVSTTLGVYSHVVPEVFSTVADTVNTASQQLLDGTYAPKRSAEQVRDQLRRLDPMLSDSFEFDPLHA